MTMFEALCQGLLKSCILTAAGVVVSVLIPPPTPFISILFILSLIFEHMQANKRILISRKYDQGCRETPLVNFDTWCGCILNRKTHPFHIIHQD
jgi:hypothetical protein